MSTFKSVYKKMPPKTIADEEREWSLVEDYFRAHPEAVYVGKKTEKLGLGHSYLRVNDKIYRRAQELGKGAFGRVRLSQTRSNDTVVIKRQKKHINSDEFLHTEAIIGQDIFGAACSSIIERERKLYLVMPYLGLPVHQVTYSLDNPLEALKISIDFLLLLYRIHQEKGYVHGDIKPSNVLIKDHVISLIDWSFAKKITKEEVNSRPTRGTMGYLPLQRNGLFAIPPDLPFLDEFAAYRTLYHPQFKAGIFNQITFALLPDFLRERIDTSDVEACLKDREKYRLPFVLSQFIFYFQTNRTPNRKEFFTMFQDDGLQEKSIHNYTRGLQITLTSSLAKPQKIDKKRLNYYQRNQLRTWIRQKKLTFKDLRDFKLNTATYISLIFFRYNLSRSELSDQKLYLQYPDVLKNPDIVYAILLIRRSKNPFVKFNLCARALFELLSDGHISEEEIELDLDNPWGDEQSRMGLRANMLTTSTKKTLGTQKAKADKELQIAIQLNAFKLEHSKFLRSELAPVAVKKVKEQFLLLWKAVSVRRNLITRSFPGFFSHPTFYPDTALTLIDFMVEPEQAHLRCLLGLPSDKCGMIKALEQLSTPPKPRYMSTSMGF